MHYYAVVGRIPFDDEDSLYTYESETPLDDGELTERFIQQIYDDSNQEIPEEEPDEGTVLINIIIESESPLKVTWFN